MLISKEIGTGRLNKNSWCFVKACQLFVAYTFQTGSCCRGRRWCQGWVQLWQPLSRAEEVGGHCGCVTGCPCGGPREGGVSPASMPLLLPCPWTAKEAIKIGVSQRLEITSDERDMCGSCPWCNTHVVHVALGCVSGGEGH